VKYAALVVIAACGSSSGDPEPEPAPPPKIDAAVEPAQPPQPPPQPPPQDPAGLHVDDDATGPTKPVLPPTKHAAHPIEITLRSTPAGARVLVDSLFVGKTPTYWSGNADGTPHSFTFVYEPPTRTAQRYAVAQYKFVPVTSGVIHAKLEPINEEVQPTPPDAGVP